MIDTIYVEEDVMELPLSKAIIERHPNPRVIPCERYGEIFNRKQQNFRLQKRKPALILARKHGQLVLPTPEGYGIGSNNNFYFSHMLNCIYDCRYCFLQGMFSSAHYVLFVNYDDFSQHIEQTAAKFNGESVHFFSGYDCDSLALESVSGFIQHFVPLFKSLPNALLELRTKSTQIRSLLNMDVNENVVVAFSLSPEAIVQSLEHKTSPLERRLDALVKLQHKGWKVGLRFDPLIAAENFQSLYSDFFHQVFTSIDVNHIHSVTLGEFRLPQTFFKKMHALYPNEKLFNNDLEVKDDMVSYKQEISHEMRDFCQHTILQNIDSSIYFPTP